MVKKQIEEAKAEINGNVAQPEEKQADPVPKNKAFSVLFDEKTNKWLAVEVIFDYQSGTLGGIRVVEQNPQKYIVVERLQVLVSQNFL